MDLNGAPPAALVQLNVGAAATNSFNDENFSFPACTDKADLSRFSGAAGKEQIRSRSLVRDTPVIPSRLLRWTIVQSRFGRNDSKGTHWPMAATTCLGSRYQAPAPYHPPGRDPDRSATGRNISAIYAVDAAGLSARTPTIAAC